MFKFRSSPILILSSIALSTACNGPLGGGSGGPGLGGIGGGGSDPCAVLNFHGSANAGFNAAGIFTVSPVNTNSVSSITPLGNLNAPYHILPTDHMYLLLTNTAADANQVLAAAPGTVVNLYQPSGQDWKIVIEVDQSFFYYLDHIHYANGIHVGATVSAGEVVGTNSGDAASVDFGVYNFNNAPLAGILNSCLLEGEAYVDSPLKYYSGALQTTLYNLAGGKDGKIDYDQSGYLVGDWVLQGHGMMDSAPTYQLGFVYHVASTSLRITVGGVLAGGGASYAVENGAPDFDSITPASGQVDYQLYPTTNGDEIISNSQYGVLSVQMISNSQIKVEIFPGAGAHGTFDGSAQFYTR